MVEIQDLGIILSPTSNSWESVAVLNPGVIRDGETDWLFYRAIDEKNVSRIGWATIKGNVVVDRGSDPLLAPKNTWDRQGLEDPRIVKVEDKFYLFYTVFDGDSARMAYAQSSDLPNFTMKPIISADMTYAEAGRVLGGQPELSPKYMNFAKFHMEKEGSSVMLWQKDAFVFPRKFLGKFVMYHRVLPGIQVLEFEDFSELTPEFWKQELSHLEQNIVMDPKFPWESSNIGGGVPPIETEDGWLIIYHAVELVDGHDVYRAGAALVDARDPRKVIGRLATPLFSPNKPWERIGLVGNVVFPTGAIVENDDLWVYYGAADRVIGVKKLNLPSLLSTLKEGYGKTD